MEILRYKKEKELYEQEKINELYSFKPEIHDLPTDLFDNNPLPVEEERRVKEKVDKNEKARQVNKRY